MARDRNAVDASASCFFASPSSHFVKSRVPGNGVSMTNCANVTSAFAQARPSRQTFGPIARQAEDERSEHVDAVRA